MARRAIDLALDLARMPTLALVLRKQPLPPDILDVIRIAAGCPETSNAAVAAMQEPLPVVKAAAVFYLEQMLFFSGAVRHRNLGVETGASKAQMRLHMRWLMRWLHPDHNSSEIAALLAARVISAWRELGRGDWSDRDSESSFPNRRISRPTIANNPRRSATMRVQWIAIPLPPAHRRGQRAVILVLAAAAVLALIFVPGILPFGWRPFLGAQILAPSATTHGVSSVAPVNVPRQQ